eukprot:CAMPEP_0170544416 /NCGR_PEP_ID=MMETSP0211-20121228/3187_1 /TAXON_ID=311385 /ORGANISM="Pseudokeronopsis sp., Strain OXSARD2" /LENGTH=50 /DNA_ID=CAMNT_0010848063 /DNA_START=33 /DNA_END=185 /DNA_ORIENTATION=-
MNSLIIKEQAKPKLVYARQRSLSDANGLNIKLKDPQQMTDDEKITWKVAL